MEKAKKLNILKNVKKLLGIRLPEKIWEQLQAIGQVTNQTTNQVAKNAIIEWIELSYRIKKQGFIMVGKPVFAKLLKMVEKEKLKPLIELISESGSDLYQLMVNKPLDPNAIDEFMELTPRLLGNNGLMWFDHVEVGKTGDKILFKAIHNLGMSWSVFFIEIFKYFIGKYLNLGIIEETMNASDTLVFLELLQTR